MALSPAAIYKTRGPPARAPPRGWRAIAASTTNRVAFQQLTLKVCESSAALAPTVEPRYRNGCSGMAGVAGVAAFFVRPPGGKA
jgi:hypothetical protein